MAYAGRYAADAARLQLSNWNKYTILELKGSEAALVYEVGGMKQVHKAETYEKALEWIKKELNSESV